MKVKCISCDQHVFNYVGPKDFSAIKMSAEYFEPSNKNVPKPEGHKPMKCPFCDKPIFQRTGSGNFRMLTDFGLKP